MNKLKAIDKHPMVGAVFSIALIHGVVYDGPNYSEELKAAETALKQLEGAEG